MAVFEDVKLKWQGKDYVLPHTRVLKAIAKVEDIFTLSDVVRWDAAGSVPMAKLSQGFGVLLRHVGVKVTDDEIYEELFRGGTTGEHVREAIAQLFAMMVPPAALNSPEEKQIEGKGDAAT